VEAGGLANPTTTPSGTKHVPAGGQLDMILAGLAALGHGQLLAHTTSIFRRKTEKKENSQARQGFKPSPTCHRFKPCSSDLNNN
jgi:hypothetical protein